MHLVCSGNSQNSGFVRSVCGYDCKQHLADGFPILDKCRNDVKRCSDNTLGSLSDLVEHLFYGVLDIGNLSGYGLALRFHKTAELAALVREVDDSLFHLREANLSLLDKPPDLALSNAKHIR